MRIQYRLWFDAFLAIVIVSAASASIEAQDDDNPGEGAAWQYTPSKCAMDKVLEIPRGLAQKRMKLLVHNFDRFYGKSLTIESVTFVGTVGEQEVKATAAEMMKSMAIVHTNADGLWTISTANEIIENTNREALQRLRNEVELNSGRAN